jgi:hypothetical protein
MLEGSMARGFKFMAGIDITGGPPETSMPVSQARGRWPRPTTTRAVAVAVATHIRLEQKLQRQHSPSLRYPRETSVIGYSGHGCPS